VRDAAGGARRCARECRPRIRLVRRVHCACPAVGAWSCTVLSPRRPGRGGSVGAPRVPHSALDARRVATECAPRTHRSIDNSSSGIFSSSDRQKIRTKRKERSNRVRRHNHGKRPHTMRRDDGTKRQCDTLFPQQASNNNNKLCREFINISYAVKRFQINRCWRIKSMLLFGVDSLGWQARNTFREGRRIKERRTPGRVAREGQG
jgi:hypothetical protein